MRVDLRKLVPNPFRDLTVDPILDDPAIRESIRKHEFWGGTVVRNSNGTLQIAAGHVRVHEAINCGITEADLFVSNTISDEDMVRIYATENATQRGVENSAVAGSVVAAIKLILRRELFSAFGKEINWLDEENIRTPEIGRANEGGQRRDGIGARAILAELGEIPGFTRSMIDQQLGLLKLSGDYDRIVNEIISEAEAAHNAEIARLEQEAKRIEEEERQRIEAKAEAIEKTKKAAETAAQRRIDEHGTADPLDLAGISKHLKSPTHVNTFRQLVLSENVRNLLPKESQAALAEELVKQAAAEGRELTRAYIRENLYAMVTKVKSTSRRQERAFVGLDWESKMRSYMHEFCRSCGGILNAATNIAELNKSRPRGVTLHMTGEFKNAVESVDRVMSRLKEEKII